ncbi:hypothetical protein AKJ57_04945 [candidate division MSBL1 archaeon SCGC-AAA259A05]|uniref:Peptidase S49 domain-containing protein n=1 Tax=candidate division MSBL1 archaeon SCGC-AAA259A05 TaxID=1698259 RepID=A0A133U6D8_9EURY|nr:hypothetical protein AKJ57_04945 [candidate division MSBL1 archaeon SCGC-AAA259A05]
MLVVFLVLAGIYYFARSDFTGGTREKPKIAVAEVEGVIENFEPAHRVSTIAKDNSVTAAVIEIDSPGGYVSPSFQLESAISTLSENELTVGVLGQLGASGAYLAASAVDNLYVHHDSLVGSLGVIAIWVSLEEYYENKGIEHYVFQTGPHKDLFAPWRGPTENEKRMIQNKIYEIQNRMLNTVSQNRSIPENNLHTLKVVKGEVVRGFQAVPMDLADGIVNTYEEAIRKAAEEAGLEDGEYKVVSAENIAVS